MPARGLTFNKVIERRLSLLKKEPVKHTLRNFVYHHSPTYDSDLLQSLLTPRTITTHLYQHMDNVGPIIIQTPSPKNMRIVVISSNNFCVSKPPSNLDVEARPTSTTARRQRIIHNLELTTNQLHGEINLAILQQL